jgi:predicted small lipoprotein YifL
MKLVYCLLAALTLTACGHKTDLKLPSKEKPAQSQTLS